MNLTEIANRCGTDKGTTHGAGHAYTIVYDLVFRHLRDRPLNLLEIGLAAGGPEVSGSVSRSVEAIPSIRMWHEYFPQSRIYGLDICDFAQFETDWFKFFRADCGNEAELNQVAANGVEFDIIVDDGSHASYHQQLALRTLFKILKPGGIYAIEDLDWQPRAYEAQLPSVLKTTDFLRNGQTDYTLFMFGDDELARLRKTFNDSAGLSAAMPHYIDRFGIRGYLRRLGEAAGTTFQASRGIAPTATARTKLAIIQKPE